MSFFFYFNARTNIDYLWSVDTQKRQILILHCHCTVGAAELRSYRRVGGGGGGGGEWGKRRRLVEGSRGWDGWSGWGDGCMWYTRCCFRESPPAICRTPCLCLLSTISPASSPDLPAESASKSPGLSLFVSRENHRKWKWRIFFIYLIVCFVVFLIPKPSTEAAVGLSGSVIVPFPPK